MIHLIGHRGYGPTHEQNSAPHKDLPENSMASISYAMSHGADGIEIDIYVSKDGVPVVIHDRQLHKHVTEPVPADADIKSLPYSCLKDFNIGADEHIPTLKEVLDFMKQNYPNAIINLDVKDPDSIDPILKLIESDPILHDTLLVSSYDWKLLEDFRSKDADIKLIPAIKTHILFGADNVEMPGYIPLTDQYTPEAWTILSNLHERIEFNALDCTFTDFTPDLLNWAGKLGVGIQISTGNSRTNSNENDYSALDQMSKAVKDGTIPFAICKVDEPDKVKYARQKRANVRETGSPPPRVA